MSGRYLSVFEGYIFGRVHIWMGCGEGELAKSVLYQSNAIS